MQEAKNFVAYAALAFGESSNGRKIFSLGKIYGNGGGSKSRNVRRVSRPATKKGAGGGGEDGRNRGPGGISGRDDG